tara:strand:+ start:90 stop:353 length:264 start_codon:yes stop_codon:yes gene_type:complete
MNDLISYLWGNYVLCAVISGLSFTLWAIYSLDKDKDGGDLTGYVLACIIGGAIIGATCPFSIPALIIIVALWAISKVIAKKISKGES